MKTIEEAHLLEGVSADSAKIEETKAVSSTEEPAEEVAQEEASDSEEATEVEEKEE